MALQDPHFLFILFSFNCCLQFLTAVLQPHFTTSSINCIQRTSTLCQKEKNKPNPLKKSYNIFVNLTTGLFFLEVCMEDKKTKHAWMLKSNSLFPKVHIFKIIWGFFPSHTFFLTSTTRGLCMINILEECYARFKLFLTFNNYKTYSLIPLTPTKLPLSRSSLCSNKIHSNR